MSDVFENPQQPWNWEGLSCNRNITMAAVIENPENPWNWVWLSINPNVTTVLPLGGIAAAADGGNYFFMKLNTVAT
jgi:hypothetical protein